MWTGSQRLPDKNNDDSEEAENTDANANASSNSVFNDTHSNAQKEAMNGLIDDDSIINHKDIPSGSSSNEMIFSEGAIRLGADIIISAAAINKIYKMAKAIFATHAPNVGKASHCGEMAAA